MASRRRRLIMVARRAMAVTNSMAAKLLSPTKISWRSGSHRHWIKRGADGRRKHEIELLELASAFGTLLLDQIAVLRQGIDAAGWQLECAA